MIYNHLQAVSNSIISGVRYSWRQGRVILADNESLIPEMDAIAFAEAAGISLWALAKKISLTHPAEWLLGLMQERMRGILEAFINHHDLGLDGRDCSDSRAALLGNKDDLLLLCDALNEADISTVTLRKAIEDVFTADSLQYEKFTARMIATWYQNLPIWAEQCLKPVQNTLVSLPKRYYGLASGDTTTPKRQAVTDFCDLVNKMSQQPFRWLFLHGSYATNDEIEASDLDTFGVLKAEIATDANLLLSTRRSLLQLWPIFWQVDPLQHHGVMCIAEQDLLFFPQPFFPTVLIEHGQTIVGDGSLKIVERESLYLRRYILYRVRQYFRYLMHDFPSRRDAFSCKHMVNMLLLAPTLILQRNGEYRYKRDVFSIVYGILPDDLAPALRSAEAVRISALYQAQPHSIISGLFSKQDAINYHNRLKKQNAPETVWSVLGPLFVQNAAKIIDYLIALMEADETADMDVTRQRSSSLTLENRCEPIAFETYAACEQAAMKVCFSNIPNAEVATFGSISAPGVSDIDLLIICDAPDAYHSKITTLNKDILAAHPDMKSVILHPISMIIPSNFRKEIGKLYPVFGELFFANNLGEQLACAVNDQACAIHQLASLAELASMYFLRHDILDIHTRKLNERGQLMRAAGIKHSYRILSNNGWQDASILDFIHGVEYHRQNLFSHSDEQRKDYILTLQANTIAAQLSIFSGLIKTLPKIVDCKALEKLAPLTVVGVWASDTLFVTAWTPEVALVEMFRSVKISGRIKLILPAEIAILFAAYARIPGHMCTFLVSRFTDIFPAEQIELHPYVVERLLLIDKHCNYLLGSNLSWGGVPHLSYNVLEPFWGDLAWRKQVRSLWSSNCTLLGDWLEYESKNTLQELRIRNAIDAGRAKEVEADACNFVELSQRPVAYYFYALTLLANERYNDSIVALNQALSMGYNPAWVLYNRAQCFLSMKRYDEAQSDLDECCRLNPDIDGISTVQEWINQAKKQPG